MVFTFSDRVESLVLATKYNSFISDPNTKKWTRLAISLHPDSLLYDDARDRLYWSTKKPATVGFFQNNKWPEPRIAYKSDIGKTKYRFL